MKGEKAIVSQYRRPTAVYADQTIHSNNQIHSSLACDEACRAGVAAAIMLDAEGNLAETHASHMAIVKDGKFYTPNVRCCPPGVTRLVLLACCEEAGIEGKEVSELCNRKVRNSVGNYLDAWLLTALKNK